MEIAQADDVLETSGIDDIKQFSIESSDFAFSVLSTRLYKDGVLAVLRELSCNAIDAHIVAGTQELDYDVHLPVMMEPWFYIRDYGTGMSRETIETVYTQFFNSTKTNDNKQIGAYGLGCKTPFSIVSQYTIESYFNGEYYLYTAFLNNGVPCLTHLATTPTNERNGVKITIPTDKFEAFRIHARSIYKWLKVPKFIGTDVYIEREEVILSTPTFSIYRGCYGEKGLYALMGGVLYSIDTSNEQIKEATFHNPSTVVQTAYDSIFGSYRTVLNLELGDVIPQPSREELIYNNVTVNSILYSITEMKDYFTNMLSDILNSNKPTIEKIESLVAIKRTSLRYYVDLVDKTVYQRCSLLINKRIDLTPCSTTFWRSNLKRDSSKPLAEFSWDVYDVGLTLCHYDTLPRFVYIEEKLKHKVKLISTLRAYDKLTYMILATEHTDVDEVRKLIAPYQFTMAQDLDEYKSITTAIRQRKERTSVNPSELSLYSFYQGKINRVTNAFAVKNKIEGGGYYYLTIGSRLTDEYSKLSTLMSIIRYIDTSSNLYKLLTNSLGIAKTNFQKFKKLDDVDKWIDINTILDAEIAAYIKLPSVLLSTHREAVCNHYGFSTLSSCCWFEKLTPEYEHVLDTIKDPLLKQFFKSQQYAVKRSSIQYYHKQLEVLDTSNTIKKLYDLWHERGELLKKRYKLFENINFSRYSTPPDLENFTDIINMCNVRYERGVK